jgi:hypothetical protein
VFIITHREEFPDIDLVKTCDACPEQYDVFRSGRTIGYLRLRHGYFRAEYGGPGGPEVYGTHTEGDGIFEPFERDEHLSKAVLALIEYDDNKEKTE